MRRGEKRKTPWELLLAPRAPRSFRTASLVCDLCSEGGNRLSRPPEPSSAGWDRKGNPTRFGVSIERGVQGPLQPLVSPEVVPVVVPTDPFVFVEIQPPILAFVFPVFLVYPPPSSTSSRLIEVEGCWPAFPAAHPPAETRIMLHKASHLTYPNHTLLAKGARGQLEVPRKKRAPRVSSRRPPTRAVGL